MSASLGGGGERTFLLKSRKHPLTLLGGGSRAPEQLCQLLAGGAGKDSAQRKTAEIHFTSNT